jgi:hypothetical protein
MGLKDDLQSDVKDIFATRWSSRKGDVVPEADDVGLDNDAVKFDEAAILYTAPQRSSDKRMARSPLSMATESWRYF